MKSVGFLRIKKLTGANIITAAARHNKREIQAELGASGHIDVSRMSLNQSLSGPIEAAGVGRLATDRMKAAGVLKTRSDAVMGIEALFSLPPGHSLDEVAYFRDCTAWAGDYFAGAEILSADIHRDETAPHCHVLLLPLIDGRMVGSNLVGGKAKLISMTKQFHADVAAKYGLDRAPKRMRTMAEIFTSPGKGPRTEKVEPYRACTKESETYRVCDRKKEQTLSCVGFASKVMPEFAIQALPHGVDGDWLESVIESVIQRIEQHDRVAIDGAGWLSGCQVLNFVSTSMGDYVGAAVPADIVETLPVWKKKAFTVSRRHDHRA